MRCDSLNLTSADIQISFQHEESEPLQIICEKLPKLRILSLIGSLNNSVNINITPVLRTCRGLVHLQLYEIVISNEQADMFSLLVDLRMLSITSYDRKMSRSLCLKLGRSLGSTPLQCLEFSDCAHLDFSQVELILGGVHLIRLKVLRVTDDQFSEFSEFLDRPNPESFFVTGAEKVNVSGVIHQFSKDLSDNFLQWDDLHNFCQCFEES